MRRYAPPPAQCSGDRSRGGDGADPRRMPEERRSLTPRKGVALMRRFVAASGMRPGSRRRSRHLLAHRRRRVVAWSSAGLVVVLLLTAWGLGVFSRAPLPSARAQSSGAAPVPAAIQTIPGMPPVPDPRNLYSETAVGRLSPAVA